MLASPPASWAIAVRSAIVMTMNQPAYTATASQNEMRPCHANGPVWRKVHIGIFDGKLIDLCLRVENHDGEDTGQRR